MRCECCEREATIHEVIIHKGQKRERHLCETCANDAGLSSDPHMPISKLIESFMLGPESAGTAGSDAPENPVGSSASGDRPAVRCASCGTTYAAFKESGLLGCPGCYDAFGDRLGPLIERAHEGGCHHVGKFPRRALRDCRSLGDSDRVRVLLGDARERGERLEAVRKSLSKAVRDEDYERAAMLRDELGRMNDLLGTAGSEDGPA
ncbi:MAG: UvrB/UvrC motif-containing protein [Planctomycetota bacterium]